MAHEQTLIRIEREQTALEEARREAVMTQEEAKGCLNLATKCEHAADRRMQELAACEEQVALHEQETRIPEEVLAKQEVAILHGEAD
ncbi:hypothetical protein E2562_021604 [Oryza meyeriana var. granulata]|uniref:Uncharacterized protein n=1 Tax=Oryza meyeriana var. granulata TaxID=110450 RepID=A0A6G1EBP9_9ORYZ|nr:hypothetical protein E2562_021604 [Oryza meyeriana var. granulata]